MARRLARTLNDHGRQGMPIKRIAGLPIAVSLLLLMIAPAIAQDDAEPSPEEKKDLAVELAT